MGEQSILREASIRQTMELETSVEAGEQRWM